MRNEIAELSERGLAIGDFARTAARRLRRGVAFNGYCLMTMDPATLLPTGHVIENGLPDDTTPRLAEIEAQEPDFNKFAELARNRRPAASLSAATGGDLALSRRHRELRGPNGLEDELRAALVGESGTWGGMVLMREEGAPHFTASDAKLLAAVSGHLAEGLRRAVLMSAPLERGSGEETGPGILVLGDDDSPEMANAAARTLLDELRGEGVPEDRLPFAVRTVAAQARNARCRPGASPMPSARVRAPSGRWLIVRGSMVGEGDHAKAAVTLEGASSPELAPLIADAYGLTERERTVTQLIAQGRSTSEIAGTLHLSPYTVQDHLKSIFEKVGVGTRGELVARLFFEHYAPRLRSGAPIGADGWFAEG